MSNLHKIFLSLAVACSIMALLIVRDNPVSNTFGSVSAGSEYNATSTKNSAGVTLTTRLLNDNGACTSLSEACPGTLGSVVITGAAAGEMRFYDATTTNVNLRTGNIATTSLPVVILPASLAAGTYTFDMIFTKGIILETAATAPTSTVTWRAR